MTDYFRLISYLESAMALSDEDKIELELTRDEVSNIISALEELED